MTGRRVAVVTGASSGIGKETAKALAIQGWRVIGIGRDKARCLTAEAEIHAAALGSHVVMLRADLSRLGEVQHAADQIAALTPKVDVLVNNAGGMGKSKVITAEGFVEDFASNHLGPFLLTLRLLPLLKAAAADARPGSVRIINTASNASEVTAGLNWDDLQMLEDYDPIVSYRNSKLANVLFARALAKRLGGSGIIALSVHPGTVMTNFASHAGERVQAHLKKFQKQSVVEGADTLIWLASADAPGLSNGGYFYQRKPRPMNPFAEDDANVERLWTASERLLTEAGYQI
jgi:NAD(P)-dependent dehydrogenase (short-subunit alcohol dehydrogenase family)